MSDLPLLLEPAQLEAALGDPSLLILDCSDANHYARFHVPGAIHVPAQSLQSGAPPAPGKMPPLLSLGRLFGQLGLTADKQVVVYDDEGGGWAGRLLWTLDVLGFHRYAYLNGGLHAWLNEGHPTETTPNYGTPVAFDAQLHPDAQATAEQIMARLGQPDFAVWDARSREEHLGLRSGAARAGHIPGAVNIDWLELMDRQRNLRLVDPVALQQRLDALGLTRDKQIVTHCQTHHRSGLSYLAMKVLGYPRVQGYDGSWGDWGNRTDTPIATA
jgi:thiosulfate/3-mercaptopyruvate sulfurtransferase